MPEYEYVEVVYERKPPPVPAKSPRRQYNTDGTYKARDASYETREPRYEREQPRNREHTDQSGSRYYDPGDMHDSVRREAGAYNLMDSFHPGFSSKSKADRIPTKRPTDLRVDTTGRDYGGFGRYHAANASRHRDKIIDRNCFFNGTAEDRQSPGPWRRPGEYERKHEDYSRTKKGKRSKIFGIF